MTPRISTNFNCFQLPLKNRISTKKWTTPPGELTNFRIKVTFPVKIYHQKKNVTEKIIFDIQVGKELEIEGLNSIINTVHLDTSFGQFKSIKKVEWFEDSIIEIQNKLPKGTLIKACISCKFSSYHPNGNGMFGGLNCFKNIKNNISEISSKNDLMILWEKGNKEKTTFNVQEIFDCSEHEFETKNDWRYKDWSYKVKNNFVQHGV